MPKVRATVKCFVDNSIREMDEVFDYDGPMIPILVSLEEDAPKPTRRGRRADTEQTKDVD